MSYFTKHSQLIEQAVEAIHHRGFYTPYPEHHKAYGEDGPSKGEAQYQNHLRKRFSVLENNNDSAQWIGGEQSPYTDEALGVTYPSHNAETWVSRAQAVRKCWKQTSADDRAGLLAEALDRLQSRYFELAYATMHTTGQSFMMAFQASGPHSNDRALEALALAWHEQKRFPQAVAWEKPMGKTSLVLDKNFTAVPKGIGLVIGCSTFPVWNTVPGLFANLAAGNPVIVKPHPMAILPIAIVVETLRDVLRDSDLPDDIVQLAADTIEAPISKSLAEHPLIKLIDFTGGNAFGDYVESLSGKTVFTEKAGVNSVVLDSVTDLDAVLQNLAFSLCLYSGQMCTAPQNFFIPEQGIREGDQLIAFDEVTQRFQQAVNNIVNNPKMGPGTLGAIQSPATLTRVQNYEKLGAKVLRTPEPIEQPGFKNARCISPAMLIVEANQSTIYSQELFGPICFLVRTKDTTQSIELAASLASEKGALTCGAYTIDEKVEDHIRDAMEDAYTQVSFNLTGFIWINQAAAFSDFHVSGGNPAGNATFANPEYAIKRFVWVQHRKLRS